MVSEGEDAPAVELPAYVDGERRRIDLDGHLGEGIVVLAFYPADFNPACTMQSSDLDDLDLFTMQKDVSVFAISPDSTYSHAAFADRYSLHIPLLSDPDGEAADAYGVATENDVGEHLVERAVFVVDHRGVVQYAWAGENIDSEIDVAPVKRAVGDIGGDDTALERYRVGHEHYVEGREAFTTAMSEYEDREWMVAFNEFEAAEPAFTAAADHFDTAVRFAETDDFETVVDRGEEKADTLQHAADWLADSADALASGRGKQGQEFRADAERLLDAASDLPDPPDPEALTLTDDGIELADAVVVDPDEEEAYAWRANDPDAVDADLGLDDADFDAAVEGADASAAEPADGDTVEGGDLEMDLDAVADAEADADSDDATGRTTAAAADADDTADAGVASEGESSIEGDTVEGDLEMDLEAIEATDAAEREADASDADAGDGPRADETAGPDRPEGASGSPATADGATADGATADGATAGGEDAPLTRGGSGGGAVADASPGPASAGDGDGGSESERPGERGPGGAAGGGETADGAVGGEGSGDTEDDTADAADGEDDAADEDDAVEQLDLADPTAGDEEDDDDERADWDIPGQ